jgi:hypothetical protein
MLNLSQINHTDSRGGTPTFKALEKKYTEQKHKFAG